MLGGVYEKAHGKPVDGLDSICKQWHSGYQCASIDVDTCVKVCKSRAHTRILAVIDINQIPRCRVANTCLLRLLI